MAWITPLIAFIFLLTGVLGLFGKGMLSSFAKSLTSWIPFGNPRIWSVFLVIVGLIFGGIAFGTGAVTGLFTGVSTAGLTGGDQGGVSAMSQVTCQFDASPQEVVTTTNVTFRSDPNDLTNYFADVKYDSGASSINGSLKCTDSRGDISKGVSHNCYVKSSTFRDQLDVSDDTTYYWTGLNNIQSSVAGYPWQQNVDLSDEGSTAGSGAVTADPTEKVDLVYAQDDKVQYLGFNVTLTGQANFDQLNNQTSGFVDFYCDDAKVGRLTLTRTTA